MVSKTRKEPDPPAPTGQAQWRCSHHLPGRRLRRARHGSRGHGIAQWLNGHGITGVVLQYRLPKGRSFVPLEDAQRAIRLVRHRAKEWKINTNKVGVVGFSAGGHLASTAATHFPKSGGPPAKNLFDRISCRPDFAILVYPVVTMGAAILRLQAQLSESNPDLMADLFSNEKQVTKETPPVFMAHTVDDRPVPPENGRMLYAALQKKDIPSEYMELPDGGHGLNG